MENLNENLIININAGSRRFAMMEECLADVIDGKNVPGALETFRKLFNLELKPTKLRRISLVEANDKPFFACHVMPTVEHLENIVKTGVDPNAERQYMVLEECELEIDSKLIDRADLTPRELMAIILHEAGHTLSDARMVAPRSLLQSILNHATSGVTAGIGHAFGSLLAGGPVSFYSAGFGLLVCSLMGLYDRGLAYWKKVGIEKEADSLAFKAGYGHDLVQAIDKMLTVGMDGATAPSTTIMDLRKMGQWSLSNIINLRNRQNHIIRLLKAQIKDEESPAARELLQRQLDALEANLKNRRKGISMSQRIAMAEQSTELNESIRTFIEIHSKGFSTLEIEEIEIEIGRIETSEDKLYLVQRIHKDIKIANKALLKLRGSSRMVDEVRADEIRDYIKELKKLVPRIKAVKTDYAPYNIVIHNPKGDYEDDPQ